MENIKQDIGEEMMLKGQDKDGDVPKTEENDEMEEEVKNAPTEARSQAGRDAEIQEVTGKEEQLAGNSSTGVEADEISVPEKEASAEDGPGNRFVLNCLVE